MPADKQNLKMAELNGKGDSSSGVEDEIDKLLRNVSQEESAFVEEETDASAQKRSSDDLLKGDANKALGAALADVELVQGKEEGDSSVDEGMDEISMDDIEMLFEEAPENFEVPLKKKTAKIPEDPAEPVSQEDIDKMLDGGVGETEPAAAEDPAEPVSQEDIDKMLDGGVGETEPAAAEDPAEPVSQDDIDKMLDGGVAEAEPAAAEDPAEPVSQDDIDKMLDGGVGETEPSAAEETEEPVSQEDIDKLLDGGGGEAEPAAAEETEEPVSQEDIDKLLDGGGGEAESAAAEETEEPVSQEDIDKLLDGGGGEAEPAAAEETEEPVSQEDIDKLLDGGGGEAEPAAAEETEEPVSQEDEEYPNFITQEIIDALLQEAEQEDADITEVIDATDTEAAPSVEDDASDAESQEDEEYPNFISQEMLDGLLKEAEQEEPDVASGSEEAQAKTDEGDVEGLVSQSDIDDLLKDVNEDGGDQEGEDDEGLVSQSDIDDLLKDVNEEGGDQEGEDDESLVSQSDIDDLLKDAGELEDESFNEEDDDESLVTQEDIDDMVTAFREEEEEETSGDTTVEGEQNDTVILEESDSTIDASGEELGKGKRPWYVSKIVAACSAAALVLIITSISLFILLRSSDDESKRAEAVAPVNEYDSGPSPGMPDPGSGMPGVVEERVAGTSIVLEGFIIMAPADKKGVTYMTADLSIDLKERVFAKRVEKHKSFFRSIVYEVLNNAIIAKESSKITEDDLAADIIKAFENALMKDSVNKVLFDKFALI